MIKALRPPVRRAYEAFRREAFAELLTIEKSIQPIRRAFTAQPSQSATMAWLKAMTRYQSAKVVCMDICAAELQRLISNPANLRQRARGVR